MRRSARLLVSLVVMSSVATGCSGSSTRAGEEAGRARYATDGTFTWAVSDDLGAFDVYNNPLIDVQAYLAYDSLVNLRPDGEFVSGLAQRWSADARSATFTLRPDVTCSDGTPLTASQVAAAITYVSDPANKSSQFGRMPKVPMTATGDDASRTVLVRLTSPFGFLLHTVGQLPIVCAKGLTSPKSLASASDGTGPFVLTEVIAGQRYTFVRRKDYKWGPAGASTDEPGTPAKVVIRVVQSETTTTNLLLSGEINLAKISGTDRQRLDARRVGRLGGSVAGATLWFNELGDRPTADVRVRQALVHALPLDEVVKVNTAGAGDPAAGFNFGGKAKVCPGDTVSGHLPAYDVAAAKALFDEAGWSEDADGTRSQGGKPLTVDLHYVPLGDTALDKPAAELIARSWEGVGVQVKLTAENFGTMARSLFETSSYDVYVRGIGPALPSGMVSYVSGPVPPTGTNIAGIHNDRYNALAAKAQALTVPDACEYWHRAEQELWREVNPVPVAERPLLQYIKGAEAQFANPYLLIPTSIRVLG